MAIPSSVIEEIKYRNDIESVVSSYITLKRRGKNLIGLCPFHGEKTPSFTLYPENGSFYCFGCKMGGDVFTFVKNIENLDYIEAVRLLADRCSVTIPEDGYDDSIASLKNRIYEINREAARFYNSFLETEEGKWAVEYYNSRGLTAKTIRTFGLGAAPDRWDALLKHLKSKGYTEEEMMSANIIGRSKSGSYYDRFKNRTMFPIINVRGNVIGFSGRRRGENKEESKYVNTSDTPVYKKSQNLFGLNLAKTCCSEQLILVEGNLDVISLHQAGFKNTVCPLGTAFTEEQATIIARYSNEVVICFDADTAGQTATDKAISILGRTGISIKVIQLPGGKDPDEFLKSNKPSDFAKLLEKAVSATEYKLLKAGMSVDPDSDEARIKYLNNAAEILAATEDPITVEYYVTRLSDKYGISKDAIRQKVKQLKSKKQTAEKKKEINNIVMPKFDRDDVNPERRGNERAVKAEETVISILIKHPDLAGFALKSITEDDFTTSLNKRILKVILQLAEENRSFDISFLAQKFSDKEIGYITRLMNTGFAGNDPKTVLSDCFKTLKTEILLNEKPQSDDDWAAQLSKIADNKKGIY